MPGAHARLSPSAHSRWSTCHLSLDLEAQMPETTSVFAEAGTRLHAIAEQHLRDGTNTDPNGGKEAELVQAYLDHVRAESHGGDLLIEQRLTLSDDLWGTADAIFFRGRTLGLGDLKTGAGVKVPVRDNGQMLTYAVMARREYESIYGPFDAIEMHIVQPALDHIDVWRITPAELDAFEAELLATVERIKSGDRRAAPSEKACQWCRAKAVCRARADQVLADLKADFEEPRKPALLSLEEIAELLPKLGQVQSWCKALEQHAFEEAEKGRVVPGYKLVTGRSNRTWRDEAEAAEALAISGVPEEKIWTKKIIGLGAAEKALGKTHPLFAEQTVKPQGAPVLVPESDPREAINHAADFIATTS